MSTEDDARGDEEEAGRDTVVEDGLEDGGLEGDESAEETRGGDIDVALVTEREGVYETEKTGPAGNTAAEDKTADAEGLVNASEETESGPALVGSIPSDTEPDRLDRPALLCALDPGAAAGGTEDVGAREEGCSRGLLVVAVEVGMYDAAPEGAVVALADVDEKAAESG